MAATQTTTTERAACPRPRGLSRAVAVLLRPVLLVTLASAALAASLYAMADAFLIFDAYGYYAMGLAIAQHGLFGYAQVETSAGIPFSALLPLRTYGYPAFESLFLLLGDDKDRLRVAVFVAQLVLWLATAQYSARRLAAGMGEPQLSVPIYAALALNPILLIHVAEPLTEALSMTLLFLAVVLAIPGAAPVRRGASGREFALSWFLAGYAMMVRPTNLILVPALTLIWLWRWLKHRQLPVLGVLAGAPSFALPFLPQVVANYQAFGVIHPLVPSDLYPSTLQLGIRLIKFYAIVIPDLPARLLITNPFLPATAMTVPEYIAHEPLKYLATLGLHGFALLDQDFPFTYIHDLFPWYRWPVSIFGYLFVTTAAFGMVRGLIGRVGPPTPWRDRLPLAAMALTALLALGVYIPTNAEIRYSTPVYALITVGFVLGLRELARFYRQARWHVLGTCAVVAVVVVVGSVSLSNWLHDQALLCETNGECHAPFAQRK